MQIDIALTEEIINESLPLHYRHAPFKQRYMPLVAPLVLIVMGFLQSITQPDYIQGWGRWLNLLILGGLGGLFCAFHIYKRNNAGKRILKYLGDRSHYEVEASADEVITRLSDTTLLHKWPAFPRAVIGTDIVLLYQQNQSFSMFHRSFFANDDFTLFKQLIRSHVHIVTED